MPGFPHPATLREMSDDATESDWPGVRLHVVTGKGGTGKTTVAAALALALASRGKQVLLVRGRGPPGHRPAVRRPPAALRGAPHRAGRRPRGGRRRDVYALAIEPEAALLEYLAMYYRLGRAGKALDRFGVDRLRHHDRPGRARRAAHRQGLRGRPPQQARQEPAGVRRRRAGRSADRPDRAVPQRQQRAGRPGQGRADPQPGRLDHDAAALAADPRAPGDRARGHAGAGDRRRHRGAPQPTTCRSAASWSTWCAAPSSTTRRATRLLSGAVPPTRGGGRPGDRRHRQPPGRRRRAAAEAREHAERRALEDEQRERIAELDVPTYELPRLADGIDLGGLYELAADLIDQEWHEVHRHGSGRWPPTPTSATSRARRRRAARRPAHEHHRVLRLRRCRQDHHLGRTGAPRRRAWAQGRGAHDRPGPAAGPVDGHRGARQHPPARCPASTPTPTARSTR